jgi:transketolase
VLLLASGSEVSLCLWAANQLKTEGIYARVVSMPCGKLFEHHPQAYRDIMVPPHVTARGFSNRPMSILAGSEIEFVPLEHGFLDDVAQDLAWSATDLSGSARVCIGFMGTA